MDSMRTDAAASAAVTDRLTPLALTEYISDTVLDISRETLLGKPPHLLLK